MTIPGPHVCPYCGEPVELAMAVLHMVEEEANRHVRGSLVARRIVEIVSPFLSGHESGIDAARDRLAAEKAGAS